MSSGAGANSPGGNLDATGQETETSPNCVCRLYRFSDKTTMMQRLKAAFGATIKTRKRLEDVKKEFEKILDPANPANHIPHPDVIDAQLWKLRIQAGSDTDDETVDEPAAQINKEMNAGKIKYASLLPCINKCLVKKHDCMMKTLEMYVEDQFCTVYDLIPTMDWMPGLELYGRQPGNKTIVMQSQAWDDKKKKPARYGDVITMPILVSGKPTNETVKTIALSEWVVIHENAFDEAENKLFAFMRAAMEANGSWRNLMCKVLLKEFCAIVTVSLWPEALIISRARQKSFKRLFHTRSYNAVDTFISSTVENFLRHPDTTVLKDYFDPSEDLSSQQDTLIARLEKEISLHLNNSGSQARERMWAKNLKMFVQENTDVQLTRDYARDFFNYIKNQVLDLEKRIKQEQEEDSKLPPPSKASKAAKDRERKKRAEKGRKSPPVDDDEGDDDQPTLKKRKKSD